MNVGCGPAFFIWALLLRSSAAQDLIPSTLRAPCEELNRSVLTQIASGHAKEAKSEVSAALAREPNETRSGMRRPDHYQSGGLHGASAPSS